MAQTDASNLLYFHINPLKNEIFYVGIGNENRPFKKRHRSIFWKNIVSKYGYIVNVVETGLNWDQACEREKFYINKIGRRDLGNGTLVNLTNGGQGGTYIRIEETIQKMQDSHKGKSAWNKGLKTGPSWNKGVKWSEETRLKNFEILKEKISSGEIKNPSPYLLRKIKYNRY